VTGLRDHLHAGSSDSFGEFLGVTRRDDAIGVAPDDQRRRGDPMNATLEPAVGHRPNKLAGAGLRPDELRQHFDALARIFDPSSATVPSFPIPSRAHKISTSANSTVTASAKSPRNRAIVT